MIILTDLSEVLIHGIQGTENIVRERYGERTGEKFKNRMNEEKVREWFLNLLRGKFCEDIFWLDFIEEDYWPFNHIDTKEIFTENLKQPKIDGTLEVYQSIKGYPVVTGMGYTVDGKPDIWIVSDHILERVHQVEKMHEDVFAIASKTIWSCDVGKIKSDAGFFDDIVKKYNIQKDEIVFIDDWNVNVEAARKAGLVSIEFHDAEQLKADLEKIGFRF
ncbi:HAD-IA family hydrolase [Candidatus Saccharibacteria bacterium]|nr:HAD-IA family hydrolase [Candidatus Saccharibacteria bacterium]